MTYIVNNWLNVLTWTAMANFVLPQNFNPTLCRSVRSNRVEVYARSATQVSSADESKASIVSWEGWIMVHQPTAPPRYTWEISLSSVIVPLSPLAAAWKASIWGWMGSAAKKRRFSISIPATKVHLDSSAFARKPRPWNHFFPLYVLSQCVLQHNT